MSGLIEPRTLSGFRDYPPELMIPRERVLETARKVYRSYGFAPIDTPAAESLDVLLGKGGGENDRLVYRVKSAKSETEEMGLRFDLTVPFARFSALHISKLGTPFKRYAMGPVWRGERPGHGRYREFWQCDFDIIGTTSLAADTETALVISDLFDALVLPDAIIRINHRQILNGLLESVGLADQSVPVLRALDKLDKIGPDKVAEEMNREAGSTAEQSAKILAMAAVKGSSEEILARVEADYGTSAQTIEGVTKLKELLKATVTAGLPAGRIAVDLTICRGLDYYTGTVYETTLGSMPGIGSVCSGGRYDNLASKYTKQVLPGVGASLGVDRLLTAMAELKHPWMTSATTPAQVLVLQFDANKVGEYQRLARSLRAAGVGVEVYPDAKKLGVQFQYAEKRGFRLAVLAGEEEFAKGTWKVKDLVSREEVVLAEADIVNGVRTLLPG